MLLENYNFNPYSGKSSDSYNHASGHISDCIKWIDEHLYVYLEKNDYKPKRFIGEKVEQFKELHNDNKDLVALMRTLIHLRNAFQHGKPDADGNQLYILHKGGKIKLDKKLLQSFQKDYNIVYNWLVAHSNNNNNSVCP